MSYVQSASLTEGTSSATTSLALSGAVTLNSILVAVVFWNSTTQTCALSDDKGGRWVPVDGPQTGAGTLSTYRSQAFWCPSPPVATPTVTATISASTTSRGIAIAEYSHASFDGLELLFDFDHSNASPSSSVVTSGVVWARVNGLVVAMCVAGDQVISAGTGYTLRERVNFGNNAFEDKTASADGMVSASFNTPATDDDMVWILSFRSPRRVSTTRDHGQPSRARM